MSEYRLRVDMGGILELSDAVAAQVFPLVSQAVRAVAEEGAYRWKDAVFKANLWEGEKTPYVDSIQWSMVGNYSAEIWSDYPLADAIENGRPARDLKRMLDTSQKTRQAKDGSKYLIIPFRHNTPSNSALGRPMPTHVYDVAKGLAPSHVLGMTTRISASGHAVPARYYHWGDRMPAGLVQKSQPHHKTDRYAGMVRFDTSSGGQRYSTFMTFRVMSSKSSGWIVPAKSGMFLVKRVAAQLEPLLEQAVAKAITLGALRK